MAQRDESTIEITELPVKTWTQTYKEKVLDPFMGVSNKDDDKKKETKQLITCVVFRIVY